MNGLIRPWPGMVRSLHPGFIIWHRRRSAEEVGGHKTHSKFMMAQQVDALPTFQNGNLKVHSVGHSTPHDFLASLDLQEAYLHVPILMAHRRFLRFCFQGEHFQYWALPFGLASEPRVFIKVLVVLLAHLHLQGWQPLLTWTVYC